MAPRLETIILLAFCIWQPLFAGKVEAVESPKSVPGGWSDWSSWAKCYHEDSSNETDQCFCSTRQCNNPVPQNGSTPCEGVSFKFTNCTIHGGWTEWSEWSACSATCGENALRTRQRSCTNPAPAFGGRPCVGLSGEIAFCTNNSPCPAITTDGWTDWSNWTSCYQKDLMRKTDECFCSTRQCHNPVSKNGSTLCEGASIKVTNCTVHGGWTEWSEWSACNPTSGGKAVKTRQRSCTNPTPAFGGHLCVGQHEDTANCTPPCRKPTRSQYYPLYWKKPINNETLPEEAIVGGSDEYLGGATYIARVFYSVWNVGKFIPLLKSVRWAHKGTEYLHNEYEILCGKQVRWLPSENWRKQPGAVSVDEFNKLYICRANHGLSVVPGQVRIDGGGCHYPFGGKEQNTTTYDVLFYEIEFIFSETD